MNDNIRSFDLILPGFFHFSRSIRHLSRTTKGQEELEVGVYIKLQPSHFTSHLPKHLRHMVSSTILHSLNDFKRADYIQETYRMDLEKKL